MFTYEQTTQQLNEYHSFTSAILNFLRKYLNQFQKALITYSIVLKHLHTKSTFLLSNRNPSHQLITRLHHAFSSCIQTFDDEYHHLEQRAKFLKTIHSTIDKLYQQISSSKFLKQKRKLHTYTYCIIRLHRHKRRQYLHQLLPQIQKHEKLSIIYKDHLDNIASETTNILWKLISNLQNSSSNIEQIVTLPLIQNEKQDIQLLSSIELGSGDQSHFPLEYAQDQRNISATLKEIHDEDHSIYSSNIDEIMIENNRLDNDKQKTKITTVSINYNNNRKRSFTQNKDRKESNNSLHLSDISYTTDYYSQNESD